MKNIINGLAQEQKELKKQRKTGTYKVVRNPWGGWDYDAIPPNVKASWIAANKVRGNRLRITAALNLYHEQRGSPYRHNVSQQDEYTYGILMRELLNEVNAAELKAEQANDSR